MIDKLNAIKERFKEVSDLIVQPEITSDMKRYIKLNKEYKDLEPIVHTIDKYLSILDDVNEAKDIVLNDIS